jgi:hypothetical protein
MARKKADDKPAAPPPARRRRGLAGKFDLLVAWAKRVAQGKDLKTKDKSIVGSLIVLGLAYYARGALAARSSAPVLNASDADTLKTVFFSGDPWLVECTSAKRPSPAVFAVEKLMAAQPMASEVKLGLLDCGATLPSGKSTLERFKLSAPSDGPLVLLFANQEARPAMATGAITASGASMLRWARETSKPKVNKPTSSDSLDKLCLKKKWCVLVFTAVSNPSDSERASLSKLAKGLRDVRFVTVDSAKYTMKLELPDPTAPPHAQSPQPHNHMPTHSRSSVLLLKPAASGDEKRSAAMALAIPSDPTAKQALDDGLKDAPAAVQAIRRLIAAAEAEAKEVPSGFTLLSEPVTLRSRRSHRRRANNGGSKSRSSDTSRTLTDAELKELRENRARAERERALKESARRAQMAEEGEAADNLVEEVAEAEEGDSMYDEGDEAEEEEEEEVEAMELDD